MTSSPFAISGPLTLSSSIKLLNGHSMPRFGIGAWEMRGSSCQVALEHAIDVVGYRHIDTARYYRNEKEVGAAVRTSKVPRAHLFVTTKLFTNDMGGGKCTRNAMQDSLRTSGLDYFDLVLLHAPDGGRDFRLKTWATLSEFVKKGSVKSLGVSNFGQRHIDELLASKPDIMPVVNQIECHPWFAQRSLRAKCEANGIVVQAYCPLARCRYFSDPTLRSIAEHHGKSPAQVMLRWSLQCGMVPLPKSSDEKRQRENAASLDFELSKEDMSKLDGLDKGQAGAVESQTLSQQAI